MSDRDLQDVITKSVLMIDIGTHSLMYDVPEAGLFAGQRMVFSRGQWFPVPPIRRESIIRCDKCGQPDGQHELGAPLSPLLTFLVISAIFALGFGSCLFQQWIDRVQAAKESARQ